MSIKLVDNSGESLGVGVNADHELKSALTSDVLKAGFVSVAGETDAGSITTSRLIRAFDVTGDYRLRAGLDSLLFNAKFPGTALDTGRWSQILSTMTATVAAGFANLNAGSSLASGAYAQIKTYRHFPIYGTFGVWGECSIQFSRLPVTNNICEVGFFLAATNAAPTDGVYMRYTSTGNAVFVINFAGTETVSSPFSVTTLLAAGTTHKLVIGVFDHDAELWIDDVLISTVTLPGSGSDITASANLPFAIRTVNSGATSIAQIVKIGFVNVTMADANTSKLWPHVLAGIGGMAYEGQAGGTLGSTALYTNSLAAGAGVAATNTTAALGSGLGGQFSLQPTLTAGTDGIISSYQVPAGTNALPGRGMYITGVKITGVVTTALTGGPVIGLWSLAYGHTAVSLATADGAGTKAPRRIPLGIQTYAATAAVGVRDDREIAVKFDTPVFVQPGEFIQTVFKNVGTVTTAGVITFMIQFDGYWE